MAGVLNCPGSNGVLTVERRASFTSLPFFVRRAFSRRRLTESSCVSPVPRLSSDIVSTLLIPQLFCRCFNLRIILGKIEYPEAPTATF